MEQILFQIVRRYISNVPDDFMNTVGSEVTFFGSSVMLAFMGDEGQFVPSDIDMMCLLDNSESKLLISLDNFVGYFHHTESFFAQFHDQIEFTNAYEQTSRLNCDMKVGRVKNMFDLALIYTNNDPFWMVQQSPCPICHLCFTKGKFNITSTAIEALRSRDVVIQPRSRISEKQVRVLHKYLEKGFRITIQLDVSDNYDFRRIREDRVYAFCERFVKDNVVHFTLKPE